MEIVNPTTLVSEVACRINSAGSKVVLLLLVLENARKPCKKHTTDFTHCGVHPLLHDSPLIPPQTS